MKTSPASDLQVLIILNYLKCIIIVFMCFIMNHKSRIVKFLY